MMSNKNEETGAKVVAQRLPIATSDSPLVIDLPDGQKIVLGELVNGAIIEVATWRGTGRPDSRTNRIMLGVSDQTQIVEASGANSSDGKTRKLSAKTYLSSLKKWSGYISSKKVLKNREQNMEKEMGSPNSDKPMLAKLSQNIIQKVRNLKKQNESLKPVEETIDLDIDAWISKLRSDLDKDDFGSKSALSEKKEAEKRKSTRAAKPKSKKKPRK